MNAFLKNCLFPGSVILLCLPDLIEHVAPALGSSPSPAGFPASQTGGTCKGISLLQTSSYSGDRRKASLEMVLDDELTVRGGGSTVMFGIIALVLVIVMFAAIMYCFVHDVTEQSKDIHMSVPHQTQGTESQSVRMNTPRESLDPYHPTEEEEDHYTDDEEGETDLSEMLTGKTYKHVERKDYDKDLVRKTIQQNFGSWKLLQQILGALAQFWAALIFMYWSLLHNPTDLMNCNAHPDDHVHHVIVRHFCNYTYACLRGFPILAANMVLVLMIRILVQNRIYYSFLEVKLVVDFADTPIMHTYWPWLTGVSMVNGGMHFLLKRWYDPSDALTTYVTIARKFVLPGFIFFSFLLRYADIENTLIPLNRIVEQDYTKSNRNCPWFIAVQVVNERVLAFDVRHRDVVGHAQAEKGRPPTIRDIIDNLSANYKFAHDTWQRRTHRGWGLFRSMWPAAVLVDSRLDRTDAETRAWLKVFCILLAGCFLTSVCSLYSLFRSGSDAVASGWILKGDRETIAVDTEALLIDIVLVWHALFIIVFLYHTVRNMFYRAIMETETSVQEGARHTVRRARGSPYGPVTSNVYI